MTAKDCLKHPWLMSDTTQPRAEEQDLLTKGLKAKFDAKKVGDTPACATCQREADLDDARRLLRAQAWRKAAFATRFINAARQGAKLHNTEHLTAEEHKFIKDVEKDKQDAIQEENVRQVFSQHQSD
jgi:hypothetical protein